MSKIMHKISLKRKIKTLTFLKIRNFLQIIKNRKLKVQNGTKYNNKDNL